MDTKSKNTSKSQARSTSTRMKIGFNTKPKLKETSVVTSTSKKSVVTYGGVSLEVEPLSQSQIKSNIAQGQQALARALDKIITPGIKIAEERGVPLFSVDPDCTDFLIRKLNGKVQRGKFVDGKFKVIQATGVVKTI